MDAACGSFGAGKDALAAVRPHCLFSSAGDSAGALRDGGIAVRVPTLPANRPAAYRGFTPVFLLRLSDGKTPSRTGNTGYYIQVMENFVRFFRVENGVAKNLQSRESLPNVPEAREGGECIVYAGAITVPSGGVRLYVALFRQTQWGAPHQVVWSSLDPAPLPPGYTALSGDASEEAFRFPPVRGVAFLDDEFTVHAGEKRYDPEVSPPVTPHSTLGPITDFSPQLSRAPADDGPVPFLYDQATTYTHVTTVPGTRPGTKGFRATDARGELSWPRDGIVSSAIGTVTAAFRMNTAARKTGARRWKTALFFSRWTPCGMRAKSGSRTMLCGACRIIFFRFPPPTVISARTGFG